MSAVHVTWAREFRSFRKATSCGLLLAAFWSVCGWSFVTALRQAEGSVLQLQTIWGVATAPWLPVLCAALTMRLFADERASGMIDLLLSSPVRERDLVLGKFLAAMSMVLIALLFSLAVPRFLLPFLAPQLGISFRILPFCMTFFILGLQASMWCAAGTLVSVFSRSQAAAAVTSLVLCCGLPTAFYLAVLFWFPALREQMASYPFIIHVYDFSTGLLSTAPIAYYGIATLYFLFVCSKKVAGLRLRG